MKLDNFTTFRCDKCHWLKQFQPGISYESKDFVCDCKVEKPKKEASSGKRKATTKKNNES